jgi:SAM-dependent methyltransferase
VITETIAGFNQRTFRRADVVRDYATWHWVEAGEISLLNRIANEIRDGEVLDIGVGGGRLVPRLRQAGRGYIGMDYSPEMIEVCRNKFPDVLFLCGDARDLGRFPGNSFRFVVFSFNGLDYMSHQDRLRVLGEVQRVLATDGYLLFSSHNIESPMYPKRSAGPDCAFEEYSIIREDLHNFPYLCYYASQREVRRQLRAVGFEGEIVCCDRDGMEPRGDLRSGWLHYLVKK